MVALAAGPALGLGIVALAYGLVAALAVIDRRRR